MYAIVPIVMSRITREHPSSYRMASTDNDRPKQVAKM